MNQIPALANNPTQRAARDALAKIEAAAPAPEDVSLLAVIAKAARDPAIDIEKFERLLAMRERIEQQQARKAFNAAVAAAKGEIGPIAKNRTVDFTSQKGRTHYKHEDFAEIARTVDPVLARHGLNYRYRSEQSGARLRVFCILSHDDGWFEETSLETDNDTSGNKNATQGVGSAATYLQRYTLKLALGLSASDQDDDGRASSGTAPVELDDSVQNYLEWAGLRMAECETAEDLKTWWEGQKIARERLGLVKTSKGAAPGYAQLFGDFAKRGKELSQ